MPDKENDEMLNRYCASIFSKRDNSYRLFNAINQWEGEMRR